MSAETDHVVVQVNGEQRSLPVVATLASVVANLTAAESGIAVAVNGSVVPRSAWSQTGLADGDHIEVLTAVQGG